MTEVTITLKPAHVEFVISRELFTELNDRVPGFPTIEWFDDRRKDWAYISRCAAQAWALCEVELSREHKVGPAMAATLFDNGYSHLHKIEPADLQKVSAKAQAFMWQLRDQLVAEHHAARERLASSTGYTGADLAYGLVEGSALLMRTDTGELPCIVTEIATSSSQFGGDKVRFTLAYLNVRKNGMLSWHRVRESMGLDTKLVAKTAQLTLMTKAQREHAAKRGVEFMALATTCRFAHCKGYLKTERWWSTYEMPIDGRVMVDPLSDTGSVPKLIGHDNAFGADYPIEEAQHSLKPFIAFTPQWVPGFSLTHKAWGLLSIDDLQPIEFRDHAFEQLVLDNELKSTIHALVKHTDSAFTDIIDGKSGGCIFLLYGPPGSGKTLTAEAVAEVQRRPLYVINVGELGTTPHDLEKALRMALKTAERWNAIVLLDEADIFLERRTVTDVTRNALVGIFLRELEYYRGVLFLTTNRASTLDPAILSRISLGIRYHELDASSRLRVWNNLVTAATGTLPDFGLEEFADSPLNGRQIKNVLRQALTLAKSEQESLAAEHLRTAVKLTTRFVEDCKTPAFD